MQTSRSLTRYFTLLAVVLVAGGLLCSLLGFSFSSPFAGPLPLQLQQVGGVAIGLALGAMAMGRPAPTLLGSLATAACAIGALAFDAVSLAKLYTEANHFSSLRWASEASTLGGAGIALALAARPVAARVAAFSFGVFGGLATAALIATLLHEDDRSRFSLWLFFSGALVAIAVVPTLSRVGSERGSSDPASG